MKRPASLQHDFEQIHTIESLTSVFESIASIHISQIKDKVQVSTRFFDELWNIYMQLRASEDELAGLSIQRNGRSAIVAITSDGGLIGDIDERIVQVTLRQPHDSNTDLFVIGTHGASLLAQHGVTPTKAFAAPDVEKGESARRIAQIIGGYDKATVFYQMYVSLMHQDVAKIDLFNAVQALGAETKDAGELISSKTYILEPSAEAIIQHMEGTMVEIALGQVLLESKLAQYASRFNAMFAAKKKAAELRGDLGLQLHRAKRAIGDERIKEILSGMKSARHHRAAG